MNYRSLTDAEIKQLNENGCQAQSWNDINVTEGFDPTRIIKVKFAGKVKINGFNKDIKIYDDLIKPSGLYNSHIQDCIIHENVYISDVKFLANYEIHANVIIKDIDVLMVRGKTRFGNGIEIDVLNEGGGRELPIYDKLSAQIAYMMVIYRHDNVFISKLSEIVRTYTDSRKSTMGSIGKDTTLVNSGTLINIWINDAAVIDGARRLEEGTIASTTHDPVFLGTDVIAKNFIILSGSIVDTGTLLTNCFVGQGVHLGKQFSAENSAFFANCDGFHGETCSIFAGPYSVTHHKSTLLIAGMFSFFNAGSGTNQSNHMYKLGPVHQGVLERGSKTGSFSYLLFPSRVGAFSAIVGKHFTNFDSSDLPFSYITEVNGKSVLTPAMNLFTVGTRRDSVKWSNRDRRKDPIKYDLINFDLFSPYIVAKAQRAIQTLQDLYDNSSRDQELIIYKGIHIKRRLLKNTGKYYEMVIDIFIGEEIFKRLQDPSSHLTFEEMIELLKSKDAVCHERWVDLAGLVAPYNIINDVISAVKENKFETVDQLTAALFDIYSEYDLHSWNYCVHLIKSRFGKEPGELNPDQLIEIISNWQTSSLSLNNMILKDAEKEFSQKSQISFGLDGDEEVATQDFTAVRGTMENNTFVKETLADSERINKIAERWLKILQ